jgi:hypothetical protein
LIPGEILVKAWLLCKGEQREVLEQACIQDLMKRAMVVSSRQMHANIVRVLHALHQEKATAGIEEMLCRLYEPIMWPHMSYANARVRSQALTLMIDAFPIQVLSHQALSCLIKHFPRYPFCMVKQDTWLLASTESRLRPKRS